MELEKGDVGQAAEKLWGAAALAVKAYAYWGTGRGLVVMESCGSIRGGLRMRSASRLVMRGCMLMVCILVYEGWCTEREIRAALERIKRLVAGIASIIGERDR